MTGNEIRSRLVDEGPEACRFVRWWRKENDFVDYDLRERFRADLRGDEEIGGFDCLSREELWRELQRRCGERIALQQSSRLGSIVSWARRGADGLTVRELPLNDETLLLILDAETGGNPIS